LTVGSLIVLRSPSPGITSFKFVFVFGIRHPYIIFVQPDAPFTFPFSLTHLSLDRLDHPLPVLIALLSQPTITSLHFPGHSAHTAYPAMSISTLVDTLAALASHLVTLELPPENYSEYLSLRSASAVETLLPNCTQLLHLRGSPLPPRLLDMLPRSLESWSITSYNGRVEVGVDHLLACLTEGKLRAVERLKVLRCPPAYLSGRRGLEILSVCEKLGIYVGFGGSEVSQIYVEAVGGAGALIYFALDRSPCRRRRWRMRKGRGARSSTQLVFTTSLDARVDSSDIIYYFEA
jgi:hypothetical protein